MQIDFKTFCKFSRISLFCTFTLSPLATIAYEPDLDNGEEINELCAGCHGEYGQGSRDGEYPRLAGQPAAYTKKQMHLFRDRKRYNLPMYEYVDERQFPDEEIADVAAYIATIKLPTQLPPIDKENFDPLARLILTQKLLNIRRAPGDIKAGERIYKKECKSCHGKGGWGDAEDGVPMIAGQYTEYLDKTVKQYLTKARIHDDDAPSEALLGEFTVEEIRNIFAYLSSTDD